MANLWFPLELMQVLLLVGYHYLLAFYRLFVPIKRRDIRGQVVLITGAGQGIGRQLALKFAEQGANLALWDLNETTVEETALMAKESGVCAFSYVCDVTEKSAVDRVAGQVRKDLGEVDILINNAGIMICKDIISLTEKDIRKTMDVNTTSHFWTIKAFLPSMMERNSGHIVTISSMAGRTGTAYLTDYCASKFAVFGLTEALRAELEIRKKRGIHMTTVCPMFVNTNLVMGLSDRMGFVDRFGKLLQPDEVAEAITDGVLRKKFYVFIPRDKANVALVTEVLPVKARAPLGRFVNTRFVDKIHED